jgi:hypothetical protein
MLEARQHYKTASQVAPQQVSRNVIKNIRYFNHTNRMGGVKMLPTFADRKWSLPTFVFDFFWFTWRKSKICGHLPTFCPLLKVKVGRRKPL